MGGSAASSSPSILQCCDWRLNVRRVFFRGVSSTSRVAGPRNETYPPAAASLVSSAEKNWEVENWDWQPPPVLDRVRTSLRRKGRGGGRHGGAVEGASKVWGWGAWVQGVKAYWR